MHATPRPDPAPCSTRSPHRSPQRRVTGLPAADRCPPAAARREWDGRRPGAARLGPGDLVAHRYELRRLLASRRETAVWLAHDRLLSRPVVLKHLGTGGHDGRHAALAEARATAAVTSRHVVAVHDVAVDPPTGAWIVMEALDGRSLAASVARAGGLALPVVAAVAAALADALAALHRAGVVHRDVKPANVQLCSDGRVVLLDLGVAACDGPGDPHPPEAVAGTLEYLAPEVVLGARATPASDLYALGATLYCAVEGVVPFRLTCVQDLVEHAAQRPGPPPSARAGWLAPLLDGLLRPDPRDRWGVDEVRRHLALPAAPGGDLASVG